MTRLCRASSARLRKDWRRRSSGSCNTIPQRFVIVEAQSRTNHREMRKRLRKVTNLRPGLGVIFFAEKTEIVTQCKQTVKQGVCFRNAAATSEWVSASDVYLPHVTKSYLLRRRSLLHQRSRASGGARRRR